MIRRIALATAAVTAAALSTGISWSSAANATTPTISAPPVDQTVSLPSGNFNDILVDKADSKLVIAGTNGVAIGGLDGSGMTLVSGVTAVNKMTLNPADGNLYATEADGHIVVIKPSDGSVVGTPWTLTGTNCPGAIAFAGSDLWFSYTCDANNAAAYGLGHLNTTDGTVVLTPFAQGLYPTQLMSIPGNTGELVATNLTGQQDLSIVTVTGTTATVAQHVDGAATGGQLAPPADNNGVIVANYSGAHDYLFSDLSIAEPNVGMYQAGSVAVSGDGKHFAVATSLQYQPQLVTYDYGTDAPVHTYTLTPGYTSSPNQPANQSLAWNDDVLYAVYTNLYGEGSELHILNTALQAPAAMSLRSAASVGRAKPLAMTLHLANLDGSPIAGGSVLVAKRDASGAHTLGTFTMGTDGFFHFTDIPAVGGANRYVAVYSGDETHGPVTVVDNVNVLRGTPVLTMAVTSKLYTYHQTGHLTVHLQSHDVKKVQIWVKAGPAPVHYYTTLTVNAHGDAAMNMTMTYNTVFVVKFYGDYYYNARVISTAVGTRGAVVAAMAGNYSTSGAYALYHVGDDVYQGTIAYPNQSPLGGCLRFNIYIWYQGRWQSYASTADCLTLDSNGVGFADLPASYVTPGYLYRAQSVLASSQYTVGNVSNFVYFTTR